MERVPLPRLTTSDVAAEVAVEFVVHRRNGRTSASILANQNRLEAAESDTLLVRTSSLKRNERDEPFARSLTSRPERNLCLYALQRAAHAAPLKQFGSPVVHLDLFSEKLFIT